MHKDNKQFLSLEIHPKGKIIYNDWVYDHEAGKGEYVERDCSSFMDWMHKRDRHVWIHPDVVLNDLFIIMSGQPELCDIAFPNCFVSEYVKQWQKIGFVQKPVVYDPREIEYLELYWAPEIFEGELNGADNVCCHGIGFALKEDYDDGHGGVYDKGSRINWGIDFCGLDDLLSLPIRINDAFQIYDDWEKYVEKIRACEMKYKDIPKLIDAKRGMSLSDVLGGVFWELSFYGSEEEKMEKKDELDAVMDDLDLENKTIEQLEAEGKIRPISDLRIPSYPITTLSISEDLNDGYINDGLGWERGYN
jgi:hypothetical protein